jgi:hypothetical protein
MDANCQQQRIHTEDLVHMLSLYLAVRRASHACMLRVIKVQTIGERSLNALECGRITLFLIFSMTLTQRRFVFLVIVGNNTVCTVLLGFKQGHVRQPPDRERTTCHDFSQTSSSSWQQ